MIAWSWILRSVFFLYFALLPIRHWMASFPNSELAFWYFVSLPFVVISLVIAALWQGAATLIRRHRRATTAERPWLVRTPVLALAWLAVCLGVTRMLFHGLPSGSYLRSFDAVTWHDPAANRHVRDDITPRQKMLGAAVAMLPGKNRAELEALLGPSLETSYFRAAGYDLIYVTGPQRDPFYIDEEWLLIWLDADGRFARYAISND